MKEVYIIGVSLLVIIWWVGVWGCIETVVHTFTKHTPAYAFCAYFSLAAFVLAFFIIHPNTFTQVLQG